MADTEGRHPLDRRRITSRSGPDIASLGEMRRAREAGLDETKVEGSLARCVSPTHFQNLERLPKSRSFSEHEKKTPRASEVIYRKSKLFEDSSILSFLDTSAVHVQRLNSLGTPRVRAYSRDRHLFSQGISPFKTSGLSRRSSNHSIDDVGHQSSRGGSMISEVSPMVLSY